MEHRSFSQETSSTKKKHPIICRLCHNKVEARQVISLMSEQLGEPMVAINPYHFTNGAT